MRCVVCGDGPPRPKLRKGDVEIVECPGCGLGSWRPPDGHRAEGEYDGGYFGDANASRGYDDYAALEGSLRSTFARRMRRLGAPPPGARLLDVGAAYGYALREAEVAGWRAVGVEISRDAARRAGAPGMVVARAPAVPFRDAAFDAVTLWDVLEHLEDPHAAVAEVARVLRPGGRLVLTTGDVGSLAARVSGARWHLYTLPEHLFFYTRRSLVRLLGDHGLRVERQRAESSVYTLGYLAERLRKTILGRSRGAPRSWPGAGLRVPVNLFDIVTVEAIRVDAG